MKLVFIYGPPATGKLTVAKELAKLTGYRVFHNHLTFDCAHSLFEIGDNLFKLSNKIRLDMFEAAAKHGVNLIFTCCYVTNIDDGFVKKTLSRIQKYGGKACFVYLHCSEMQLMKRVKRASRKNFDKIKTCRTLRECINKWDFGRIPFVKSLDIENTKVSARKAAIMIKGHFRL